MPSFLDTFRRDTRPGLSSFWVGQEPPEDETPFERWYREVSRRHQLDPDPDDPEHFYDWRAAYEAGATADSSGHWPSEFKLEGHPNLFIEGIDTRTGLPRGRTPISGALPTEEMPALQTAGVGTGVAGVGRDILSGTLGLGANLTGLYNQPFRALEPLLGRSPVGQAQDWLQEQARGFQETPDPSWMPGEGAPRGAYSEALIESSVAAGNEPWEAAVADTARATLGLADPMDLMPAGAAGTLGTFLQRFLRKGKAARAAQEGFEVAARAGRAEGLELDELAQAVTGPWSPTAPESPFPDFSGARIRETMEADPGLQSLRDQSQRMGRRAKPSEPQGVTDSSVQKMLEILGTPPESRLARSLGESQREAGELEGLMKGGDPFDLSRLTVNELRQIARDRNLPSGGTKDELLFRLNRRPKVPGAADDLIARIENKADDIGPQRELIAYDAEGKRIGDFEFFEEAEELRPFIVTTTGRGTGVGRRLYREAVERYGKPIGESMARSDEGEGFRRRLMETDPDLFAPRRALDAPGAQAAPEVQQAAATPQQPLDELQGASGQLSDELPFRYNARERFGLDDEAATAWTEMIEKDLPAFQAQRRADGPSNQEVMDSIESIASANGMTVRRFMDTKPGTTFNREELMFLDSAIQRRTQDIGDLSRRLETARAGNLGEVDRLQLELAQAIYEQNSLLKVSVGASSETGRALQSRQQFVRALKKCFGGR